MVTETSWKHRGNLWECTWPPLAVAVAAYFVINPFLVKSFDVMTVWSVLDVLMVIGLALALIFNFPRKREECQGNRILI